MRAPLVVTAMLLAGCLAGSSQDALIGEPQEAPLLLSGCRLFGGEFLIDAEAVDATMPPGFVSVRDPSGQYALGQADVRKCEGSAAFSGEFQVVPPEDFKDPAIDSYVLTDGGYVQDPALLHELIAAGFSAVYSDAQVSASEEVVTPGLWDGQFDVTGEDGDVHMDWTRVDASREAGPQRQRVFVADGNQGLFVLLGYYDLTVSPQEVLRGGLAQFGEPGIGALLTGTALTTTEFSANLTFYR